MTIREIVRVLIGDTDSGSYTYSDTVLTNLIITASQMYPITGYSQEFSYSYAAPTETVTPTPSEKEKRLIALQTQYIIKSVSVDEGAANAIKYSDSGNSIDTNVAYKSGHEFYKDLENEINKMILDMEGYEDFKVA